MTDLDPDVAAVRKAAANAASDLAMQTPGYEEWQEKFEDALDRLTARLQEAERKAREKADHSEQFYAAFLDAQAKREAAEEREAALREALTTLVADLAEGRSRPTNSTDRLVRADLFSTKATSKEYNIPGAGQEGC